MRDDPALTNGAAARDGTMPYLPHPGRDGQRTGRFEERTVDFYIRDSRNVLLFWPKA